MHINDFDYKLPEELIAQKPQKDRDKCRLMVLRRSDNSIEHRHFFDILEYLKEGDCLLLNDSKVIPARLYGIKEETGARVEFLLIKRIEGDTWETMVRPGKRLKPGDSVVFSDEDGKKLRAEILDYGEDGTRIVKMEYDGILMERLEEIGSMPLPPYISRPSNDEDKDDYQTVYCHEEGSVAAPTAGLHFTTELLEKAREKGVKIVPTCSYALIENHHMHFEEYSVSEETAEIVNETVLSGGRVISVGTTSTRTAESAACFDEKSGKYLLKAGSGSTDIFIYPGYEFKIIESLITNFHLPKSTLMMLVSALYDREHILKAYDEAVRDEYRFFSYGDAMFIE